MDIGLEVPEKRNVSETPVDTIITFHGTGTLVRLLKIERKQVYDFMNAVFVVIILFKSYASCLGFLRKLGMWPMCPLCAKASLRFVSKQTLDEVDLCSWSVFHDVSKQLGLYKSVKTVVEQRQCKIDTLFVVLLVWLNKRV